MKTPILAISILAVTALTVAFFPNIKQALSLQATIPAIPATTTSPAPIVKTAGTDIQNVANQHPKIEVVFVLDTTSSMSGLIDAAKEKIWSIASTMASAQTAPDIKMGLVAFRDRGDAYITKTIALSSDLDSMYSKLMDFKAEGGGDGPESVNKGLYDAVHKMPWSQDKKTYKVVFLIGDAPAHMDYQDDVKYPETIAFAQKSGIVINAIQSGENKKTSQNWQQIASLGQGKYFQVENNGNAVAIATPFDKELAELSVELDETRVYFGNKEAKVKQQKKVAASRKLHSESSEKSLARRVTYNTSESGTSNFLGDGELVDAISSGKTKLSSIAKTELPKEMQDMTKKAQQVYISGRAEKRAALKKNIKQLAEKRDTFLKEKVVEVGANKDSFDARIFSAIQSQASEKGMIYTEDSAKY